MRQARTLLRVGFTVLPIAAGLDKLTFDVLADWTVYAAPFLVQHSPLSVDALMKTVGAVEVAAGIVVAITPRIGAYIVAAWLVAIIVNLLLAHGFYDIAARDAVLALAAVALGRLYAREAPHAP